MSTSDFVPIKRISKGGYGTVVLAKHKLLDKLVAIKIMKIKDIARKNAVDKVKVEQQIYKLLSNSSLKLSDFTVQFYGSFKTSSHYFLVLDYCPLGDLGMLLNESGAFGEQWGGWLIAEIATGLSILHKCGIIYNDLKPENILMSNNGHIKFTDFGISKLAIKLQLDKSRQQSRNQSRMQSYTNSKVQVDIFANKNNQFSFNQLNKILCLEPQNPQIQNDNTGKDINNDQKAVLGTPHYIAPELLRGDEPTEKSDFWALGVCLFEFVFGFKPFDFDCGGDLEGLFFKVMFEEVRFPEDQEVSGEVKDLILRLLEKDPGARLSNLDEFKAHSFFKAQGICFDSIFSSTPPVVPREPELCEEPMDCSGDWVKDVLQEESSGDELQNLLSVENDFDFMNSGVFAQHRNCLERENVDKDAEE